MKILFGLVLFVVPWVIAVNSCLYYERLYNEVKDEQTMWTIVQINSMLMTEGINNIKFGLRDGQIVMTRIIKDIHKKARADADRYEEMISQ